MSASRDATTLQRRTTIGMGTFISIEGHLPELPLKGFAGVPLDAACEAIEVVESLMNPANENSDLARIARAPRGVPVQIHPWTTEVLALRRRIHDSSRGVFDPCTPDRAGRLEHLEILGPECVRRTGPDLLIDLGGIAKGFAVDRAIDVLKRCGCIAGIVNAGGDLRVFGDIDWPVEVRTGTGGPTKLMLREKALAVSAPPSANSPRGHRGYYLRVDAGIVANAERVVAVCARDAATADALTKVALLHAPGTSTDILAEYGAQLLQI
jgi:thiamine biosynthesis lipoprotein